MSISISGNGSFTGATADYSFDQSVGIAGTLTYEDVTSVDSVGVITTRSGIEVGPLAGIAATISANGRIFTNATDYPYRAQGALVSGARAFYVNNTNNSSGANYHFYGNNADGASFTVTTAGQGYFKGDVGIGTNVPQATLHLLGSGGAATGNEGIRLQTTQATGGNWISFNDTARKGYFGYKETSDDGIYLVNEENSNIVLGTNGTERLRITSAGNIGINDNNPAMRLCVKGAVTAGGGSNEDLQQWNIGSDNVKAEIKYLDAAADRGMLFGTTTDHNLLFQSNNTERMRITNDGAILLGATTVTYETRLKVQGTNTAEPSGTIRICRDDAAPNDQQFLGSIQIGDSSELPSANVIARRDGGTWSGSSKPGALSFGTAPDGGTSPTERMRIDSTGKVIISADAIAPNGLFIPHNTQDARYTTLEVTGPSLTNYAMIRAAGKNLVRSEAERNIDLVQSATLGTNINVMVEVTFNLNSATSSLAGVVVGRAGYFKTSGANYTFWTNTPTVTMYSGSGYGAGTLSWVGGDANVKILRYGTDANTNYTNYMVKELVVTGYDFANATIL